MEISENGLRLIEQFEGFVGHPYQDVVGVWTIGYGHTHGVGPSSPSITQAQAEALLRQDVMNEYGAAVNALGVRLGQNQYDALTSFVYNLGPGVLQDGAIGGNLRAGNYAGCAAAMLGYDHAGGRVIEGLYVRRVAEQRLFLTPDEPPRPTPKPDPLAVLLHGERMAYDALKAARPRIKHPRAYAKAALEIVRMRAAIKTAAEKGRIAGGHRTKPGWSVAGRKARYALLGAALLGRFV